MRTWKMRSFSANGIEPGELYTGGKGLSPSVPAG